MNPTLLLASAIVLTGASQVETPKIAAKTETAILAGGCFWCVESDLEKLPGVMTVESGYTGGTAANPSYKQVSAGGTGHVEAVRVIFDQAKIGYAQILDAFWHNIDPTDPSGQFCDKGDPYRSAIFYLDESQKSLAEASRTKIEAAKSFKGTVVTTIQPAGPFYPAEDYHQDYYKKNPIRYRYYRTGCGRDRRLKDIWGDQAGGH